jgi:radical SAM superfamily enzyme YgiQ (UPF0313 family)
LYTFWIRLSRSKSRFILHKTIIRIFYEKINLKRYLYIFAFLISFFSLAQTEVNIYINNISYVYLIGVWWNFGTTDLPNLLKVLNANYKHELVGERILTTPKHYAYLKISEGCNRPCSFCAIPLMRGKHRSVPIENLVFQAKKLASIV